MIGGFYGRSLSVGFCYMHLRLTLSCSSQHFITTYFDQDRFIQFVALAIGQSGAFGHRKLSTAIATIPTWAAPPKP
jgi:hypothetical protein